MSPTLFVAVVDDRPDAVELRAAVANAFDGFDAEQQRSGCQLPYDPAAFHPEDRRALVVHPSASGADLVTTELDQPGLHWVTNQVNEAERAAWVKEVTRALEPKAAALGPFAPLTALERITRVLSRQRPPEDAAEVAVAGLLRDTQWSAVMLAVAHEDEGSEPPESLLPSFGDRVFPASIVVPQMPALAAPPVCVPSSGSTTPRYAAWLGAQPDYLVTSAMYWPCTELPLVPPFYDECWGDCLAFTPVIGNDGSVDCHVDVETNASSCDATYGWLDPARPDGTRAPRLVEENGVSLRLCEVRQLTGAALESCAHSLDCPECEPGWCYTQVRELWGGCDENPNAFRFVVGSDRAAWGHARIRCDSVEPTAPSPQQ